MTIEEECKTEFFCKFDDEENNFRMTGQGFKTESINLSFEDNLKPNQMHASFSISLNKKQWINLKEMLQAFELKLSKVKEYKEE